MIMDNLSDIVIFSSFFELTKVINQRSHAGRKVKYTIYQLTQGDLAC
jgi:hypothetical protein